MNVAKIHDRMHIKTFWEKKINTECQYAETEEQRKNKSSLDNEPEDIPGQTRNPAGSLAVK
ncbi:hypothetical protein KUCAC02_027992, partial [Chaenocephalus aceratus]